jgi:hypothetical protein
MLTIRLQTQWISIIFYSTSLQLTKLSIVIVYIQIFYYSWIRHASYGVLVVLLGTQIWVFYVIFTACDPLPAFWDPTIVPAVCRSQAYWLSNQYLAIATDFIIFLLPVPVIWDLKIRLRQKCLLLFLFTMGLLYVFPSPGPLLTYLSDKHAM